MLKAVPRTTAASVNTNSCLCSQTLWPSGVCRHGFGASAARTEHSRRHREWCVGKGRIRSQRVAAALNVAPSLLNNAMQQRDSEARKDGVGGGGSSVSDFASQGGAGRLSG